MTKQKPLAAVFDYDDVCADFTGTILKAANLINGTTLSPEDVDSWDLPKDLQDVYKRFEDAGLYNQMKPLPFAIDAINHIRLVKNHEIIILTARDEKYGEQTYLNLLLEGIPLPAYIQERQSIRVKEKSCRNGRGKKRNGRRSKEKS